MAQRLDPRELRLRVISAVALGALAFIGLWFHELSFAALVMCLGIAMAWEWGRAVRSAEFDTCWWLHSIGLMAAVVAVIVASPGLAAAIVALTALAVLVLSPAGTKAMSAAGVVYVGVPALLVVWLRQDTDHGTTAILFILLVVAAHDTFAMMTGKLIGGPRLWPLLSPNKTWSGVAGGLIASLLAGLIFAVALGSDAPVLWLGALGLILGLAGFAGDLAESAFKRRYQIKHASSLVPGHGGLLDRLDGLLGAVTVAAIIGLALNAETPAHALLFLQ